MSTTFSSHDQTVPSILPADSVTAIAPVARKGRRLAVGAIALVACIALVTTGSRAIIGWTAGGSGSTADLFRVGPRNFSVVLIEKGELKAAKSTDVICEVEGRSTIITLVAEGTAVTEGDLLVELASDQIDDRIRQEELKETNAIMTYETAEQELEIQRDRNDSDIRKGALKIELAHLELEKYEKGDWVERKKNAEIAIEEAKIKLQRRTQDFKAAKELRERRFITQTEYDEADFEHQKAIWELERSERAKTVQEQYTHVADLRQRQSDLDEATKEYDRVQKKAAAEEAKKIGSLTGKQKELELIQDQLAKFRRQKDKCRITAPTQGFVVYYSGGGRHFMRDDSQIREGASVHERQTLLSLPDTSKMLVIVRIHEAKTDKLSLGQRVTVTIEGIPNKQFTGAVTKIAVLADSQNRWLNPDLKEYETEITLDATDVSLKPGVTAYASIMVESVEAELAIPVQAIYSKGDRRYVFNEHGSDLGFSEVDIGAIGTRWAQITGGLSLGDHVLLAFSDEHKRMIPDLPPKSGHGTAARIAHGDRKKSQNQSHAHSKGSAASSP